ncbi:MAG: DUF4142 domain-containing protein [Bacteroidia bacterium]|nr:DUF4142 domain-containing protein [Bacteroidia bacterium]
MILRLFYPSVYPGILMLALCLTACDPTPGRENAVRSAQESNERLHPEALEETTGFMVKFASVNRMGQRMGEVARQKSKIPAVLEFARASQYSYQKILKSLDSLASRKQIALPAVPGDIEQAKINDLIEMQTPQFEEAYLGYIKAMHDENRIRIKEVYENTPDPQVQEFAEKMLVANRLLFKNAESLENHLFD